MKRKRKIQNPSNLNPNEQENDDKDQSLKRGRREGVIERRKKKKKKKNINHRMKGGRSE